jgi:RNA polymerase sigma-70 factor (ECF subfamily)
MAAAVALRPEIPSFEQVYGTYFDFVWRYALHRGVPPSAVDDVVQEVFIVVHRKLATFEGRSSLRTWLAMIARRVARDHLRKRGNRPMGEPLDDHDITSAESPAEILEQRAAAKWLDHFLSRMTDVQREVFVLHEIEQMTGVEIAETLGINENTVFTRLRAARRIFESGVERVRAKEMKEAPCKT